MNACVRCNTRPIAQLDLCAECWAEDVRQERCHGDPPEGTIECPRRAWSNGFCFEHQPIRAEVAANAMRFDQLVAIGRRRRLTKAERREAEAYRAALRREVAALDARLKELDSEKAELKARIAYLPRHAAIGPGAAREETP